MPRLIRVFAVRLKKARILSYPLSSQRRLRSDWVDVQADPSLHSEAESSLGAHAILLVLSRCGSNFVEIGHGHEIISMAILCLMLMKVRQLSVTGESILKSKKNIKIEYGN